jgi:hypothetical protein
VSQISPREGYDLLEKLLSERTKVHAMLSTPSGTRVRLNGFVDSITRKVGLVLSVTRPPSEGSAFMSVPLADNDVERRCFSRMEKTENSPQKS